MDVRGPKECAAFEETTYLVTLYTSNFGQYEVRLAVRLWPALRKTCVKGKILSEALSAWIDE
jgi:hypothetical protein